MRAALKQRGALSVDVGDSRLPSPDCGQVAARLPLVTAATRLWGLRTGGEYRRLSLIGLRGRHAAMQAQDEADPLVRPSL